jgi:hypothetical protein
MLTSKILELGRQNRSASKSPRIGEAVAIYGTADYVDDLDQTPDDFDLEVLGSTVLGSTGRGEEGATH